MASVPSSWNSRVEQELSYAVCAADITARIAHLELAILHLEADCTSGHNPTTSRQSLTTALFVRLAFAPE